jgi:predicted TPR repeat methyltransferase
MNKAQGRRQQKQAKKPAKNQKRGRPVAASDLQTLFQDGLRAHQAGQLPDAEAAYRRVLELDADHADANHLLGVIAHQAGDHGAAVELIGKAIRHAPSTAAYHCNLGNALHELGRLDEAAASQRQAIALNPDYAKAHNNLANVLLAQGRSIDAVASYQKALSIVPDDAETHVNLGIALHELGRLDEAEASYRKALALDPDYARAHTSLGNTLQETGRLEDAVASHQQALSINPDYAEAHANLGNALKEAGQLEDAAASHEKAIRLKPDLAEAHNNLGSVRQEQGRLDEAAESYRKALAIKPDYAEAHNNLGVALQELGKLDEALASYRRALDIDPGLQEVRHYISSIIGETTDIAPEEYVRKLFDVYAQRFDDHLTNTLGYKIPALTRQAVDALPDGPETFPRVLDLGCGTGMVAENFRDIAGEIDGVDLSPKMLEQAEAKGVYANLYLADVLEFLDGPDVRPAGYDLIVSAETFVYIGKLDGIFTAARQALTDSGLFVFSVEHLEDVDGDFKLLPSSRYSQSDAYIEKLAAESGFAVVCHDSVVLRKQNKSPMPGRIFVLRATV